MPLRRLPSLTALRAFEAAARLRSFKAAAQELNVTPGAISQQIRMLEEDLGAALFTRTARQVTLTDIGEALSPDITDSFLRIRQALDRVNRKENAGLKLNASAAILTKFLLPRLPGFTAQHPEIPIHFETQITLNALDADGPDVAIRVTRTPPEGVYVRHLFDECLLPVASPELVRGRGLDSPDSVISAPLLPDGGLPMFDGTPHWAEWFDAAGIKQPDSMAMMRVEKDAADYPVDMAIAGMGVMLCRASLCHSAILTGQLVCPFGPVLQTDVGVYLLSRHDRKSEPHVRAFIEWIQAETSVLRTLASLHGAP